jgi:hypothetical protein
MVEAACPSAQPIQRPVASGACDHQCSSSQRHGSKTLLRMSSQLRWRNQSGREDAAPRVASRQAIERTEDSKQTLEQYMWIEQGTADIVRTAMRPVFERFVNESNSLCSSPGKSTIDRNRLGEQSFTHEELRTTLVCVPEIFTSLRFENGRRLISTLEGRESSFGPALADARPDDVGAIRVSAEQNSSAGTRFCMSFNRSNPSLPLSRSPSSWWLF